MIDYNLALQEIKSAGFTIIPNITDVLTSYEIAERFNASFLPYYGDRELYHEGHNFITKARDTTSGCHLHGEAHYMPYMPDLLFFYYEATHKSGGETILCDGTKVASDLKDSVYNLLKNNTVLYRSELSPETFKAAFPKLSWEQFCDKYSTHEAVKCYIDEKQHYIIEYITTAFCHSKLSGTPKEAYLNNILIRYKNFNLKSQVYIMGNKVLDDSVIHEIEKCCQTNKFKVNVHDNDLLIIDNKRMMHGKENGGDGLRKLCIMLLSLN